VRVQRVVMPFGGESSTLLSDGVVVEPVERFLAHLTSIERAPNTVRAYAHDLRDFFAYLRLRELDWTAVVLEDIGRFVAWLRQLKVSTQDRGALIGEVLHQRHVFALPSLQHRSTVAGAQVTHPVRLLTEHGYQIALTLIVGDNYRERNRAPRLVAA
jgi:hypothetical protein